NKNAPATEKIAEKAPAEPFKILGIELGRTTIKDLGEKYQTTYIMYFKKLVGEDWKGYVFDSNDFGTKELPLGDVTVFCDENGLVHSILLRAPVSAFDDVKSKYISKDFVLSKEEQKEGTTTVEYKSANTAIQFNKTEKELTVRYTDNESDKVKDKITDGKTLLRSFYVMDATRKDDKTNDKKTLTNLISDGVDDLKPLGINIGTTTEDELKEKYEIVIEMPHLGKMRKGFEDFKALQLNVSNLHSKNSLQKAIVLVDKKNTVQAVLLFYSNDCFKDISERLAKKYSMLRRGKDHIVCKNKKLKNEIECSVHKNGTSLEYRGDTYAKLDAKLRSMPQNPAPYNIKLGETTENEIRFKYKVVNEFATDKEGRPSKTWKEPYFHLFRLSDNPEIFAAPNLTVLILDPEDFSSGNLPVDRVSVAIDENKKVCVVSVVYPKKMADYLNKQLKEKYKVSNDRSWRFVDRYVLYKANNAMVGLFFEPKEAKDERANLLLRLYRFVDPLNGYDSVAINYCLEDVLKKYKQWVKETDQKIQNLL
ncbi:MAG: hypothetical protein K6C34_02355, partial [Alphaproteobacteria bacterium]|nr:hypothetical protein [Alphaproteobacteria bacterium]